MKIDHTIPDDPILTIYEILIGIHYFYLCVILHYDMGFLRTLKTMWHLAYGRYEVVTWILIYCIFIDFSPHFALAYGTVVIDGKKERLFSLLKFCAIVQAALKSNIGLYRRLCDSFWRTAH
jgi:hypothetical protein